jgi:hypothetical protein
LREKYLTSDGGPGVYNRFANGEVWRKTQSITPPPKPAAAAPATTTTAAATPAVATPAAASSAAAVPATTTTATATPAASSAVSDAGTPGLEYTLINNNKEYAVSKGTVRQGSVVIPATYNNLPVTSVGFGFDEGFKHLKITDVTIPNSVTKIGTAAFLNCGNLTSITIPASVTSIEQKAFERCNSLTSVTFQGTITADNFDNFLSFPGDLRAKYLKGGPGTYTRPNGKNTWTKK